MREFSQNIFFSLLSLVLTLCLAELAVRCYTTFISPKMMQYDGKLGWKHVPSVRKRFVTELGTTPETVQNRYGHRGSEYPREISTGKTRILAVGDSFCEGSHVEEDELFTAKLVEMDSNREVLNAGVGGYSTVQEYLYLRDNLSRFNPDTVLLMMYENDLDDNCLSFYPGFGPRPYATSDGTTVQLHEKLDYSDFSKYILPSPFQQFLQQYSEFYYFINSRIYRKLYAEEMGRRFDTDVELARRCDVYLVAEQLLKSIQGLVNKKGKRLIVAFIPTREEAKRGESETFALLTSFCANNQVDCLDLTPSLYQSYQQGQKPYFPEDIHWTAEGHAVAAQVIHRVIVGSVVEERVEEETGLQ